MIFAEMSDTVWLAWIAIVAVVVNQVLAWISSWIAARSVAKKVEEVKTVLATSNEESKEKLSAIHTLVNSNRGETLTIASVALDRVAELTKNPKDIAAADVAKKLLREHQDQQAIVDKRDS